MALVTRASDASIDATSAMRAPQIAGDLYAGENLDAAAPCRIGSDGLVYMSNATAANTSAEVWGFTPRAVVSGQPVTLFGAGARFKYGSGLTPGATFYAAATAGRLDTATTTGDAVGVAKVVSATDIIVIRANGKNAA